MNAKLESEHVSNSNPIATARGTSGASTGLAGNILGASISGAISTLRIIISAIASALLNNTYHKAGTSKKHQDTGTLKERESNDTEKQSSASDGEISDPEIRASGSDLSEGIDAVPLNVDALLEALTIAESALNSKLELPINQEQTGKLVVRDSVQVKLGLVRAYIELGDNDLARSMFNEVRKNDNYLREALANHNFKEPKKQRVSHCDLVG